MSGHQDIYREIHKLSLPSVFWWTQLRRAESLTREIVKVSYDFFVAVDLLRSAQDSYTSSVQKHFPTF